MRNLTKFIGIALLVLGFSGSALAQITASAYAEATIVSPINIVKDVDMNFGNVAVINSIGTIVLSTASGRTGTGGATPVTNPTGTVTAASFTVTGLGGAQVFVTLPASATVVHTNGTDDMIVNTFVCSPVTGFVMPGGGSQQLLVGATLNTEASQLPGVYHTLTDFNVTVNYQ